MTAAHARSPTGKPTEGTARTKHAPGKANDSIDPGSQAALHRRHDPYGPLDRHGPGHPDRPPCGPVEEQEEVG